MNVTFDNYGPRGRVLTGVGELQARVQDTLKIKQFLGSFAPNPTYKQGMEAIDYFNLKTATTEN